jgi:hypothetical protein
VAGELDDHPGEVEEVGHAGWRVWIADRDTITVADSLATSRSC